MADWKRGELPPPLPKEFTPARMSMSFFGDVELIDAAGTELDVLARDPTCGGVYGFYAGPKSEDMDRPDMRACQEFAKTFPTLEVFGKEFTFRWLRAGRQGAVYPKRCEKEFPNGGYHLDADEWTGQYGRLEELADKVITSVFINLHPVNGRNFQTLNVDALRLTLRHAGIGQIIPVHKIPPESYAPNHPMRPRNDSMTSGLVVAVNRVLHTGSTPENGAFFVGSWARVDPVSDKLAA